MITTNKLRLCLAFLVICSGSFSYAQSLDLTDLLNQTENDFNQGIEDGKQLERDAARRAENRAANRDRSKDVCYQLPANSDAQIACLGEHPYAIRNDRARNIVLGICYSMGSNTELSNDLTYVCENGVKACGVFDDGDAGYWCGECGATRTWLAVYSLGHIIQCYN